LEKKSWQKKYFCFAKVWLAKGISLLRKVWRQNGVCFAGVSPNPINSPIPVNERFLYL